MRLLVLMLTPLLSVQSEKTGNNVVKCAACRTMEQRVESWECKVNCEVIQGSQDDVVTYGVITDLIERLNRLEENNTAMAQRITELEGEAEQSLCHAKGSGAFGDAVCLLMQRLNAGDEVSVKFAGSGQIRLEKSYFQATFLYNTN